MSCFYVDDSDELQGEGEIQPTVTVVQLVMTPWSLEWQSSGKSHKTNLTDPSHPVCRSEASIASCPGTHGS